MKKQLVLTLFGLGRLPFSATLASAIAAAVYLWVGELDAENSFYLNADIFFLILVAALAEFYYTRVAGDPKEIVADEFLGMFLCLLIARETRWISVALLFVAFRILDIFKFPPFTWIEHMKSHYAILWDDLAIGACIGLVYTLCRVLAGNSFWFM
jgi:phosphatidylglycerophosphatase A